MVLRCLLGYFVLRAYFSKIKIVRKARKRMRKES